MTFVTAIGIGSALLALWVDARFPALLPETARGLGLALAAAFLALNLSPAAMAAALEAFHSEPTGALAALGALLAPLTAAFLVGIWLLRFLARATGRAA